MAGQIARYARLRRVVRCAGVGLFRLPGYFLWDKTLCSFYTAAGAVSYLFEGDYRNALMVGAQHANCIPANVAFTPQEAWNIDTKLDDGKPGTGKIVPRANGLNGYPNCSDGNNTQAAIAAYKVEYSGLACALYFRR